MRYFISRICLVLSAWDNSNESMTVERYVSTQVLEDLKLWKNSFLPAISKGMSINLITYCRPSFLCWSDACPDGMGGFDLMGHAWRLKIPDEFQDSVKNKNICLEFIASIITVWQAILQNRPGTEECILSLGDNSSSVGWLHKASINPSKNLPLFLVARKFAQIMLDNHSCIYSQHIPGISNKIADALSCQFDLSDDELTRFVNLFPNSQVQNSNKLFPGHPEINSWMTYWLRKCNKMKGSQRIQEKKKNEYGGAGLNTQSPMEFSMTSGFLAFNQNNKLTLLEPSLQPSDDENFLSWTREAWLLQQSRRPWQNWVRSLGQMWGTTPHMEPDLNHCTRYLPGNSRECKI